jgi:sec-independent protein translocase protein TatC
MTVVEHLEELRYRLIVSALTFLVGSIVAWIFYPHIFDVITLPLDEANKIAGIKIEGVSVRGVTTAFLVKIKISVFAGFVFALPVILLQLWRFITPGLEPREKRYAIPFVTGSLVLFLMGTVFAYWVLPQALGFLLGFGRDLNQILFIDEYVGFVAFMVLAFGITFEFPMLLLFLALAGIISSAWLRKYRRHAIVLVFVIAAVATPSQDPYTMGLMALPLYLMYEGALLIVRFIMKK